MMFSPHNGHKLLYRREVLRVWKSKNGLRATYKNLLGKFITAEHEGAKAVCEVLQKKGKMWYRMYTNSTCMIVYVYEQESCMHAHSACYHCDFVVASK